MSPSKRGRSGKRVGADPSAPSSAGKKRVGVNPAAPANAGKKRVFVPATFDATDRITWVFGALDVAGPFARGASLDDLETILRVVCDVEKRTVSEVFDTSSGNRQTVGAGKRIPCDSLHRDAQARLAALELDDHDELWELRITKRARLWCLRNRHLISVLWWDPNHDVCP